MSAGTHEIVGEVVPDAGRSLEANAIGELSVRIRVVEVGIGWQWEECRSGSRDAVGIALTSEEPDGVAAVHEAGGDREHLDHVPDDRAGINKYRRHDSLPMKRVRCLPVITRPLGNFWLGGSPEVELALVYQSVLYPGGLNVAVGGFGNGVLLSVKHDATNLDDLDGCGRCIEVVSRGEAALQPGVPVEVVVLRAREGEVTRHQA